MADAAPRLCNRPGCRGVVRDDRCSHCGPVRRSTFGQPSGSTERGYGADWRAARARAIAGATLAARAAGFAGPLCALCRRPITGESIHVDHVRPFTSGRDPLRLDAANLRVAHARCHMQRTARQRPG